MTSYESIAGLTNPPPIQTVFVGSYKGAQSDGNGEVALDIEVAMSMAPGLSKIVCYESSTATAANSILSLMATNTAIKQFGSSWDFTSNPRTTMDTYFQKFIAQGQSFFDASGDSGAYAGAIPEPDDDPYVTVVGGTALLTSGLGNSWSGEITWNAPDLDDSSSGGIDTTYAIPTWQAGVSQRLQPARPPLIETFPMFQWSPTTFSSWRTMARMKPAAAQAHRPHYGRRLRPWLTNRH